jgi:hypothetical protein
MAKKELPEYTRGLNGAPAALVEYACRRRNDGTPCSLYKRKQEVVNGEKAIVHYCNGNSVWCDHITTIGLILSDERSELYKKAVKEGLIEDTLEKKVG